MLQRIHVRGFGCVRNAELGLTPLHALIGPNDSGKSTLLRAIQASHELLVPTGPGSISRHQLPEGCEVVVESELGVARAEGHRVLEGGTDVFLGLGKRPATLVAFDPYELLKPSPLIPESELNRFMTSRGFGLAGIYQSILSQGDETFLRITEEVRRLFPTVKSLRLPAINPQTVILRAELTDGTQVNADQMSHGLLYYLAFRALQFVSSTKVFLIEEPENGLHPARIRAVVAILRALASTAGNQVILTTHSPLVINELQPEEVSLCVRRTTAEGTRVVRLMDTPSFEKRSRVYALGELWLAYADGELEAPLLGET
ncbi:MAG: AAA family ATPase [Deltaproteobacteria bacterium]|nr:AAA family ATPase [Deltaproteobacteria bacterium]